MATANSSYIIRAGENEIFGDRMEEGLVGQVVAGWTVVEAIRLSHKQILIRLQGEIKGLEHISPGGVSVAASNPQ